MDNKKPTLHVITKYFLPVSGGIENNIFQTHRNLVNRHGWNVIIHTSTDSYLKKDCFPRNEELDGLKIKRYQSNIFGFMANINWQEADVVALHNFDIFFLRYLLVFLLHKITGKKNYKTILSPHGGFNPKWSMFSLQERIVKFLYTYTLGALLVNLAIDKIRTVSQWEKNAMSPHIRKSLLTTIDNGLEDEAYLDIDSIATEKIKKEVENYGLYFVQVARIYSIKNIETAILAMLYIPKNIKFIVLGEVQDIKYKEKLIKLAKDKGLSDRVIFAGIIKGVDKYYLMKHAFAMVHMALWESYCNVVREGMSQGLPCIVSDSFALPHLIRNGINGFNLPAKNYVLVAEKLNWILSPENKSEVVQIKKRNVEFGKNNSWVNVAAQLNNLYR